MFYHHQNSVLFINYRYILLSRRCCFLCFLLISSIRLVQAQVVMDDSVSLTKRKLNEIKGKEYVLGYKKPFMFVGFPVRNHFFLKGNNLKGRDYKFSSFGLEISILFNKKRNVMLNLKAISGGETTDKFTYYVSGSGIFDFSSGDRDVYVKQSLSYYMLDARYYPIVKTDVGFYIGTGVGLINSYSSINETTPGFFSRGTNELKKLNSSYGYTISAELGMNIKLIKNLMMLNLNTGFQKTNNIKYSYDTDLSIHNYKGLEESQVLVNRSLDNFYLGISLQMAIYTRKKSNKGFKKQIQFYRNLPAVKQLKAVEF